MKCAFLIGPIRKPRVKKGLVIAQNVVDWNSIHHGLLILRVVLELAGVVYVTRRN